MDLRKNVEIEGIPFKWDTNLSDEDIRDLYLQLVTDPDLHDTDLKMRGGAGLAIQLRMYENMVEFKSGLCQVFGVCNHLFVIYRTTEVWLLWEAHQSELEELKQEQEQQFQVDRVIFLTQDRELRDQIADALNRGDFGLADQLFQQRLDLRQQSPELGKRMSYEWSLSEDAFRMYARFPTSDRGIRFIRNDAVHPYVFVSFADSYHYLNRSAADHDTEIDKIFRAGLEAFPNDGYLYKHACLFWRRHGSYSLAIRYCEEAVDKGLKDDTKSGFPGRLKRLIKEADKKAEPKERIQMDVLDQATDIFMKQWGDKSLEDLRQEALQEENGIVFESMRAQNGPRMILLVCVTDAEKLPIFEEGLHLPKNESGVDWQTTTIGTTFHRMGPSAGLRYEDLRDEAGNLIALTLFASDPESVATLEKLFQFPK